MVDEIFRITPDKDRAEDLFKMAKKRLKFIKIVPSGMEYKIVEEYYEIIKELITALMYIDGYKTLSHMKLIEYLQEHYDIPKEDIRLIDNLRKFRIGIVYYGKKIQKDFLINYEEKIKKVISILFDLVEKKLYL